MATEGKTVYISTLDMSEPRLHRKKICAVNFIFQMSVSSAAVKCKRITLTHYRVYSLGCKFCQRRKKKKKNNQSAKTQRVDPPKFTTRMPKTSRPEKDGDALIFPAEFFAARSSPISRYRVNATKRNFMGTNRHRIWITSQIRVCLQYLIHDSETASVGLRNALTKGKANSKEKKIYSLHLRCFYNIRHLGISWRRTYSAC